MKPYLGTVLVLALSAALAPASAQDQKIDPKLIPEHLKLKGDPAPDLDLGGMRMPPLPSRTAGTVTHAGYICQTCIASKLQSTQNDDATVDRLLGREASVIRPWLGRLSKTKPHIISNGRLTVVAILRKSTIKTIQPEEQMRLRMFFGNKISRSATSLDGHEQAHLWMDRLLTLDAAIADLLDLEAGGDLKPTDAGTRPLAYRACELYLFSDPAVHTAFTEHVMDSEHRPIEGMATTDGPLAAVLLADVSDEAQRRRFIHSATLQLLRRHRRLDGGVPAWLSLGIAHFMERRLRGMTERQDDALTLPEGMESPRDWNQFVRDMVVDGKAGALGALTATPARSLTLRSRVQAWSLVSFLLGCDQDRFALLMRRLLYADPHVKAHEALLEAVQAAYDTDLVGLERAWKYWVLKGSGK